MSRSELRKGEGEGCAFRSERYFTVGDQWYFATREGIDSGPYDDRHSAESALEKFLYVVSLMPDPDEPQAQSYHC